MTDYLLTLFPPVFIMLCGIISYIIGRKSPKARDIFACAVTLSATAFYALFLFTGKTALFLSDSRIGYSMMLGGFGALYAFITSVMWLVTTLFSTPYFKSYDEQNRYYLFSLLTFGATLGVFLSANIFTLFIFFEIMSFTSYVMVVHDRTDETRKAASTYLTVSVIGGLVLFLGLCIYSADANATLASLLMLVGFGAKAGAFPLHVWLPKAHPVAPAPASALLSGVLTKTGIYGVLLITAFVFETEAAKTFGTVVLVFGVITMLLGGVLALLSVNIKRTLACSSMSQIGFILVGTSLQSLLGEENLLACGGTVLHMVNHSVIKLVLFVCAGIIYMNLHKLNLNDIQGFGRKKPFFAVIFTLGSLDICGIPPFGGYISKTLLHESLVEYANTLSGGGYTAVKIFEWLFLITGGLTVAYMTKLFVCLFVKKPSEQLENAHKQKLPLYTAIPLGLCALVLPVLGIFDGVSRKIVGIASPLLMSDANMNINFFSLECLKGSAISVTVGILIYFAVVKKLTVKNGIYVDFSNPRFDLDERIYKPVFLKAIPRFFGIVAHIISDIPDMIIAFFAKTVLGEVKAKRPDHHMASIPSKIGMAIEKSASIVGIEKSKRRNLGIRFSAGYEAMRITLRRITRNLSFAMIIACIGLCAALLFLFLSSR